MDAMTEVLSNSDEVDQLILRNTGLTDELLKSLATALKRSPSEVTVINLNLNQIRPPGVNVLLDLLHAKPQIKELLYVSCRPCKYVQNKLNFFNCSNKETLEGSYKSL